MAREGERVPLTIPVKCVPVGSDVTFEQSLAVWTSDVNPTGTGFVWPLSSKPQACPVCMATVTDLNCPKPMCPSRALHAALMDNGWIQIQGLNNVPGWEEEKKVLAKVVWFRADDDGANFQFGVRFKKTRPPIRTDPAGIALQEIHPDDLSRWKASLQASLKQVLIVNEDKTETEHLEEFLKAQSYSVNTVAADLAGMAGHFAENPKLVFFNPVFGGRLKMDILEHLRQTCPDASLILIANSIFKNEILDSPQFRLANFIFIQPLDFDRIRETLLNA